MFCAACGQQIAADANFCPLCGSPQSGQGQAQGTRWETCQIRLEAVATTYHRASLSSSAPLPYVEAWRFVAEAIGPDGPYQAAVSDELRGNPDEQPERIEALRRGLVGRLVGDGWEPLPPAEGVGQRFRRRIAS